MRTPAAAPTWLPILCCALAACAGVATRGERDYDFAAVTSYGWKDPPQLLGMTDPAEETAVLGELQRRVDRLLERRGMTRVDKGDAQVLLVATIRVDTAVQQNDPQFSLYVAEEYERATLRIDVYDRMRRRLVWSGERTDRLRYTARAIGGTVMRFTPVDAPREWHVEPMVERIVGATPLGRGADQPPDAGDT